MKKIFSTYFLLVFSVAVAHSQTGRMKTLVIDNKVLFSVPASFKEPELMTPGKNNLNKNTWRLLNKKEDIMIVYELGEPNDPNAVDVGDNDVQEWADKQLTLLKKQPEFSYLDDGNFLQDGKNIGYIKYTSKQAAGRDTYHLLFITSVDNKLVQFTFTCPANKQKKWEPIADAIANSLRVPLN